MKLWALLSVVIFGLALVQGCSPEDTAEYVPANLDPSMALGPEATTPVPADAKLITPTLFESYYYDGYLRVTNDRKMIEDVDSAAAQFEADKAFVDAKIKTKSPAFHVMFSNSPRLNSMRSSPVFKVPSREGTMLPAPVLSLEAKYSRMASALRASASPENQLEVYRLIYERADASVQARFPRPDDIAGNSAEQIWAQTTSLAEARLASGASAPSGSAAPIGDPNLTCQNDIGNGALNSDRYFGSCGTHTQLGVQRNLAYPMKNYVTCVKNQANRGTCGAFAIVAAIETEVMLKTGNRVNLSEQDLYAQIKQKWWPSFYGDGINPHGVWQRMIGQNYVIPFESLWDYNPSNSRYSNTEDDAYINSCKGYYGAECSNTVHQAGLYCTKNEGYLYCGFMTPINESGHGYRVTGESEVWNGSNLDGTIAVMRASLDSLKPVLLSSEVPPTFDNPDANGYAGYTADAEKSRGGHIYQLTGYVTNEKLEAELPLAPRGAGGGYFIAKNSWSACFADAGYIYLPFAWVKKNGWSATVLNSLVEK